MTGDPVAVAEARRVAGERQAARLAELLAHPEWISSFDTEAVALLKANRPVAVAHLDALKDDPALPADKRVHATLALRILGVEARFEDVLRLADSSAEAAVVLLDAVDEFFPGRVPLPAELRPRVARWVGSPNVRLHNTAVRIAGYHQIGEAGEELLRQVKTSTPRSGLLVAAAAVRPSEELLAILEGRLEPVTGFTGSDALAAVARLGEVADPVLRRRAAQVAVTFLSRQDDHPWIDGATSSCVEMIATVKPVGDAQALLAELTTRTKWKTVASCALNKLDELDPAAAAALSKKTGYPIERGASASGRANQTSTGECARLLVEAGILTQTEAVAVLARPSDEHDPDDLTAQGAWGLLGAADRLVAFDVETGTVPNRHDLLLGEFAAASAGRFAPEAALENYVADEKDPDHGAYTVQFVHSGRLYRFHPEDLGDWYDVPTLVAAVHQALTDAGVPERFVGLDTGDQTAAFIFARPDALRAVGPRLGLSFAEDLDASRKAGKAFEDRVREDIGK